MLKALLCLHVVLGYWHSDIICVDIQHGVLIGHSLTKFMILITWSLSRDFGQFHEPPTGGEKSYMQNIVPKFKITGCPDWIMTAMFLTMSNLSNFELEKQLREEFSHKPSTASYSFSLLNCITNVRSLWSVGMLKWSW